MRGVCKCGATVLPPRRVCEPCKSAYYERQREVRRAYDRKSYAVERANRPKIGDAILCGGCGKQMKRTGSNSLFCPACAKSAAAARKREKYRASNGVRPPGTVIQCSGCKVDFVLKAANSRYCVACKTANVSSSLSRKRRLATDPAFALRVNMGAAINKHLRTGKGGKSWIRLVGYTPGDLKRHLERQFLPGMSWENRRLWHIDHIVPLALLPADTPEHPNFLRAWALCNLRPLWKLENEQKHKAALFLC
jgi:hypothetical protein